MIAQDETFLRDIRHNFRRNVFFGRSNLASSSVWKGGYFSFNLVEFYYGAQGDNTNPKQYQQPDDDGSGPPHGASSAKFSPTCIALVFHGGGKLMKNCEDWANKHQAARWVDRKFFSSADYCVAFLAAWAVHVPNVASTILADQDL